MSEPLYVRYLDGPSRFDTYEDFKAGLKIRRPKGFNFAYDALGALAAETPDALALLWTDENGGEARYTFMDIERLSCRAANALRRLGIGRGDAVLLILKRHPEFWPVLMALHKLGAIAIPATHLLTEKDIRYRVNAANVKLCLCSGQSQVSEAVDAALPDCPTLQTRVMVRGQREGWLDYDACIARERDRFDPPEGDERPGGRDVMLLYFTSGTAGPPKMVAHTYEYPLAHIVTAVYWQRVVPGGLHLTVSETGWAKAMWGKLYGQWLGGSAVFVYDFDRFHAANMLRAIEKYGVTSFCAPPTTYRYLLQEDFSNYDLSRVAHFATAGEAFSPDMAAEIERRTGKKVMEAFGQTELTVTLGTFPGMAPRPGSMGKPSPLYDVDIVDETLKSCPPGQSGEIVVRTGSEPPLGMFAGYYGNEALTRGAWQNGVYRTGDVGWRDEWGYYYYVSRADDVIKSSGYRIGPSEVESALATHEAVLECAVTGVRDELRGQVVKATVVLKPGFEGTEALKKELQAHVRRATAPYKYPRVIEFVHELPKTISGKIRRAALREEKP